MPEILSKEEAARYLGVSPVTLRNLVRTGEIARLPAPYVTAPLSFTLEEVERLRSLREAERSKHCQICGKSFSARKKTDTLCGDPACTLKRNNSLSRKNYAFEATCQRCGEAMPRTGTDPETGEVGGRKYCGKCRPIARNQDEADREFRLGLIRDARVTEARVVRVCACGKATRMRRGQWWCSPECREKHIDIVVANFVSAIYKMRQPETRIYR